MTILLVSDDDRSALACKLLADQLKRRGESCLTVGPLLPSSQLSPLPVHSPEIPLGLMDLLGTDLMNTASAIGVFVQQPDQIQPFAHAHRALARERNQRPAVLFSGPLDPALGDGLTRQLCERLCCDLVLFTGERQLREANAITQHWPSELDTPQLLAIGLWYAPERPPRGSLHGSAAEPPHTLLALVQRDIPTQVGAKAQLLRQLIDWAEASPEWSIVIQREHSWKSGQAWIAKFQPEDRTLPPNLVFAMPGQLLTQLATCSACMSVSSFWSLTAMVWGHPTMLVGDYGIHTDQGTNSFFGSGVMHRMRSITHLDQLLDLPSPNQAWLRSMGWGIHDGADRLLRRLKKLAS